MALELPRCVICRVTIHAGQTVQFREDGRVHHAECPPVTCPVCERSVRPGEPIRRDADRLVHANCWMRLTRAAPGQKERAEEDL